MPSHDSASPNSSAAPAKSRLGGVGKRAKNNLVALGSVAVITVYSAGYSRTREAAQRFDEADGADRRRPAPVPNIGVVGETSPGPSRDRSDIVPHDAQRGDASRNGTAQTVAAPAADASALRDAKAAPVPADKPAASVASATSASTSSAAVADSAATKAPAPLPPAAPDSARAIAQAAADSAAQAERDRGQFKDGTYYGWGTSRHGDIQAGVEIKNGHIYDAWIQQCLTRYSCSWISALPGQVLKRQSPDVDFVSGATQSTNAFYYAVSQALTRAK